LVRETHLAVSAAPAISISARPGTICLRNLAIAHIPPETCISSIVPPAPKLFALRLARRCRCLYDNTKGENVTKKTLGFESSKEQDALIPALSAIISLALSKSRSAARDYSRKAGEFPRALEIPGASRRFLRSP
jgi:hypothetical protein